LSTGLKQQVEHELVCLTTKKKYKKKRSEDVTRTKYFHIHFYIPTQVKLDDIKYW